MSEEEFVEETKKIGITLSSDELNKFKIYTDFLIEYSSHTNLTAIKEKKEIYLKHFYDSLLILKYYSIKNEKVIDIGSGAGFPGVVLKIVCPFISLYLLDSNGKKTKFLEELKEKLNIDFNVINDRAENYVKQKRECFDLVVSRAVADIKILAELTICYAKEGGTIIFYKGNLTEELETGKYAINELGGEIVNIYSSSLPYNSGDRTFVIIKKKCKTDTKYPRSYDKIIKKPLQKR